VGSSRQARTHDNPSIPNKIGHAIPKTQDGGRNGTLLPAWLPIVQTALVAYPMINGVKNSAYSDSGVIY